MLIGLDVEDTRRGCLCCLSFWEGSKHLETNVAKDSVCGFMWYLSLDNRTCCVLSTCSALSSKPALFQEIFVIVEQLAPVFLYCNIISPREEDTRCK